MFFVQIYEENRADLRKSVHRGWELFTEARTKFSLKNTLLKTVDAVTLYNSNKSGFKIGVRQDGKNGRTHGAHSQGFNIQGICSMENFGNCFASSLFNKFSRFYFSGFMYRPD